MIKVGLLNKGDWFIHKSCTYEVLEVDYVFVKAKKKHEADDTNYYLLKSVKVDPVNFCNDWKWENPNHVINDKYGKER